MATPNNNYSTAYETLADFIENKMKMSHVYQPAMLHTLLSNNGETSTQTIAKQLLQHDESQTEYYRHITKNMVGRVLSRHGLITKSDDKATFLLSDFNSLTPKEINRLMELCDLKIAEYKQKRGMAIWEHRRKNRRPVPGSVRFEVLKRAKKCCELCGISADQKALEVDHIIPKNLGGIDDITNYQALCYSCNASKRDRDSTDFRGQLIDYEHRLSDCLFCNAYVDREVLAENTLAYAIADGFPVTEGHCLIIPKRHATDFFELTMAESNAINYLMIELKKLLCDSDPSITGFNIGMNAGESAGQTVFHSHTHLMPRREGDVASPRGGVRHTIPGKGNY
jgi:diadenosine tetraphosphate (Ap4A) HIT family hydrolase